MSAEDPTIEWKTPPVTFRDKVAEIAATLRQNENAWAVVAKNVKASEAGVWKSTLWSVCPPITVRLVRVDAEPIATLFEGLRRYDVYAMYRDKKDNL